MVDSAVTILLAEDNKANQFISKAMIENLGARVLVAENGLEVLELLRANRVDLILMDCQMPEMDGLEATRQIRAMDDAECRAVPIIALTADAQQETRDECLKIGMNDYLTKPFTFDALNKQLDTWVK